MLWIVEPSSYDMRLGHRMRNPKVTIGLPVYNGARFLEAALEGILAQDLPDFDLVVSDNASTDATPQILAAFAAREPRLRVIRQAENIGASRNFAVVLGEARAPYFLWAGHDDIYAPADLRKTLAALEANPSAILAVSQIRFIDGEGRDLQDWKGFPNLHTVGLDRVERLRQLFVRTGWYAIYGLARPEHLRMAGMERPVFGPDVHALRGRDDGRRAWQKVHRGRGRIRALPGRFVPAHQGKGHARGGRGLARDRGRQAPWQEKVGARLELRSSSARGRPEIPLTANLAYDAWCEFREPLPSGLLAGERSWWRLGLQLKRIELQHHRGSADTA